MSAPDTHSLFVLSLLTACSGMEPFVYDDTGTPSADTDTDSDADTDADADTDTDADADADTEIDDEALFRSAVAGTVDAAEALQRLAASGGLPVATASGTFLFGCLCGAGTWRLAGDHDGWVGAPMAQAGALHWIEVDIASPDGSLYKFTDGGSIWLADPLGRRYGYDENGMYSLVRASAAHLERWYDLSSGGLASRDLHIWVPDGGAFTHLLLVQDGQNLFDPGAIWGGWRLAESLPEGVLAVGIENTADRMAEYTHTLDVIHGTTYGGQADAYLDFVDGTVRPLVTATYGEPAVVGIMGSSLGGLVSVYAAWRDPARYDMAISLSGTMGWGSIGSPASGETVIELFDGAGRGPVAVFLDSGGYGPCQDSDGDGIWDDDPSSADNYCENAQLRDVLSEEGYIFEDDLWHWHEPGAAHNEAAWAARVYRPLEAFVALD